MPEMRERLNASEPPGTAEPELKVKDDPSAKAVPPASTQINMGYSASLFINAHFISSA